MVMILLMLVAFILSQLVFILKNTKVRDLPNRAHLIMSNSVADHGRLLSLLEKQGLIKIKRRY